MLKLIGVELFKLRKRWMPYILLLVLLAITLLPILVNYISYQNVITENPNLANMYAESLVLPDAMNNIFNSVPGLGMFLVAFLAASVVGTEYGWGTLRQTLAKGTSRNNYLTSKLLAIAIAVVGGILIVVLIGFIVTIITSMLIEGNIEWDGFAGYFFASLGRTLIMLALYMSMAAFFAVLLRSSAAGIAVVVAWLIGESIIMALLGMSTGWLAEVPNYLTSYNINELMSLNSLNPPDDIKPWWQSGGVLLAYTTVFITAAYYFFHRQDLTA